MHSPSPVAHNLDLVRSSLEKKLSSADFIERVGSGQQNLAVRATIKNNARPLLAIDTGVANDQVIEGVSLTLNRESDLVGRLVEARDVSRSYMK